LCLGLVALGVWLRMVDVGFPAGLTWDEHHFVLNARNYLAHAHDWNDHPPLGKLLLAIGMLALGDTSTGWRVMPMLFGIASIALARALGTGLFRDRRAGWMAAAFVAGDGFLIAYSRTALLDGMLTTLVLATACLAVRARSPGRMALVALAIGCAASVKMSAFALGLPVALLCLAGRQRVLSLATLAIAPALYTALFALGLWLSHEPHSAAVVWRTTYQLLAQHVGAHSFTHPLTSHWYTWFWPKRPITIRYDLVGVDSVRASTTLGNLLLWWSAAVALLGGLGATVGTLRLVAKRGPRARRPGRSAGAATFLFVFALAMLLPWMIGTRDSYIYHYLPSYAVLLVLVGGLASRVYRRRRAVALTFVAAVTLVSVFYAPAWGQLELTRAAFDARLFLPSWR
jgi:dolichyl-phosphate-mannose--protein O-mannosyl transferase